MNIHYSENPLANTGKYVRAPESPPRGDGET